MSNILIDGKFERATFVTLDNPNEDIAQLITLKTKGKKNAVALRYCPFCGNSINFMNNIKDTVVEKGLIDE